MTLKPWAERDKRVFSRFALFCRSAHVPLRATADSRLEEFMECPRQHLARISQNVSMVNDVAMDVFPSTGDKGDPLIRPPASFLKFGKSQFVVVSDGWVRAAAALES